ncbi:MAG: LAGLIDADG family homing endonuclease [Candidatus Woesearchaeota archaeon]
MGVLKITPELAEIAGIHAGDGYLRYRGKRKEVDISGGIDEKEYYDQHVIPLFNRAFGLSIRGRYFRSRNTYGFRTSDLQPINMLSKLGFPSGKKTTIVKVPREVLDSSDSRVIASFLRGYFDTDGCLTFDKKINNVSDFQRRRHYYPRLMFSTCSMNLNLGFQRLIHELGFVCRVYRYKPRKETESLKYKLQLTGKEVLYDWMRLIGSRNPSKMSRYLIWQRFGFCPPDTSYEERVAILRGELDPHSYY